MNVGHDCRCPGCGECAAAYRERQGQNREGGNVERAKLSFDVSGFKYIYELVRVRTVAGPAWKIIAPWGGKSERQFSWFADATLHCLRHAEGLCDL